MLKRLSVMFIVLALALTSFTGVAAQDEEASEECEEVKGELIAFTPARSERYVNGLITGLQNEAANACYDITILENEFNQAEQDQQVQQQLAIGTSPDMWIWWPAEGAAGLGSLRDLASTDIPVLQINQLPTEEAEPFVIGYAGPDDALRAANAGEMMAAVAEELELESANAIAVTYPVAYGGYPLSIEAFLGAIEDSGIELVAESNEGFGSQNGYNGAAALIAQLQDEEIDFIYGMDDAILQGAIQALEEAGFTVGVDETADIIAVGTVCNGDRQLFEEGRQYGTTLQAPLLEGQLAIQVADEFLTSGEIEDFLNFTPNPAVLYNEWEDFTLEGFDGDEYTMNELCTWGVPESDEEEAEEDTEESEDEESSEDEEESESDEG